MTDHKQDGLIFELQNHKFISFVTHENDEEDRKSEAGEVRFLSIRNDSGKLVCVTLKFSNPFESRLTDMTMWSLEENDLTNYQGLKDIVNNDSKIISAHLIDSS